MYRSTSLIDALLEDERRNVLVTSGTVTSARMMSERLPSRAIHQFVPIDLPSATARFLDHWRPDAGLFVDSDIWPNLVFGAKERGHQARAGQCTHVGALFRRLALGTQDGGRAALRLRHLPRAG